LELWAGDICQSILPPVSNYYDFLDLPHTLVLDEKNLEQRFYALSRKLHPDLFSRKSAQEQAYSTDASAVLNDAYRTLRDPLRRAEYLLEENGLLIAEQQTKDVPPELLEEVFELNMALEELRMGDDDALPQLAEAKKKFAAMQGEIDHELLEQFAVYDAAPGKEALATIRSLLNRRRYIRNLVRDVDNALSAKTT
jgi:molecular chaperone HscB